MLAPPSTRINFEHLVPRLLYSKEMSRTGGAIAISQEGNVMGWGKVGKKDILPVCGVHLSIGYGRATLVQHGPQLH